MWTHKRQLLFNLMLKRLPMQWHTRTGSPHEPTDPADTGTRRMK